MARGEGDERFGVMTGDLLGTNSWRGDSCISVFVKLT